MYIFKPVNFMSILGFQRIMGTVFGSIVVGDKYTYNTEALSFKIETIVADLNWLSKLFNEVILRFLLFLSKKLFLTNHRD